MRGSNNGDNAVVLSICPLDTAQGRWNRNKAKLVRRFAEVCDLQRFQPSSNLRSVRPIRHTLDSYQLLSTELRELLLR